MGLVARGTGAQTGGDLVTPATQDKSRPSLRSENCVNFAFVARKTGHRQAGKRGRTVRQRFDPVVGRFVNRRLGTAFGDQNIGLLIDVG